MALISPGNTNIQSQIWYDYNSTKVIITIINCVCRLAKIRI